MEALLDFVMYRAALGFQWMSERVDTTVLVANQNPNKQTSSTFT